MTLGPSYDPRYSPTVGFEEGGVSYERCTSFFGVQRRHTACMGLDSFDGAARKVSQLVRALDAFSSVLESQLPHKIVHLLFIITNSDIELTVSSGS